MQYVYSQHRNELYGETIKYQAARENIYDDETDTHTERERDCSFFIQLHKCGSMRFCVHRTERFVADFYSGIILLTTPIKRSDVFYMIRAHLHLIKLYSIDFSCK